MSWKHNLCIGAVAGSMGRSGAAAGRGSYARMPPPNRAMPLQEETAWELAVLELHTPWKGT
jgi:hypothetical protein